jgi:hypothetical protein
MSLSTRATPWGSHAIFLEGAEETLTTFTGFIQQGTRGTRLPRAGPVSGALSSRKPHAVSERTGVSEAHRGPRLRTHARRLADQHGDRSSGRMR